MFVFNEVTHKSFKLENYVQFKEDIYLAAIVINNLLNIFNYQK